MYDVQSLSVSVIKGRGVAYVIKSPVTAERNFKSMKEAIGDTIIIDGIELTPIGYDMFKPATPVSIGEKIGVLVAKTEKEGGENE